MAYVHKRRLYTQVDREAEKLAGKTWADQLEVLVAARAGNPAARARIAALKSARPGSWRVLREVEQMYSGAADYWEMQPVYTDAVTKGARVTPGEFSPEPEPGRVSGQPDYTESEFEAFLAAAGRRNPEAAAYAERWRKERKAAAVGKSAGGRGLFSALAGDPELLEQVQHAERLVGSCRPWEREAGRRMMRRLVGGGE